MFVIIIAMRCSSVAVLQPFLTHNGHDINGNALAAFTTIGSKTGYESPAYLQSNDPLREFVKKDMTCAVE